MASVTLELPHHRYDILIEPGILASLGAHVRALVPHEKAALIADSNVAPLYAQTAESSLRGAGYHDVVRAVFPAGEGEKHLRTIEALSETLATARVERKSPVVALGGGVTGDMAGFVAASFLRGVPFVQCPTTLLAMVDSSVGGKTGVNLAAGKNLVGAFYQPHLVLIDTDTLGTLPLRELRCGLAECVKHAVLDDSDLFAWIEKQVDAILSLDAPTLVELVRRNVAIKARIVMADEKETGIRAHLNLGHTFGHAIEATSGYGHYEHGEGVALGMVAATRLAIAKGVCAAEVEPRLVGLLQRIGLPTRAPDLAPTPALMEAMRKDKKVSSGSLRFILPERIGSVDIKGESDDGAIARAWESLRS